MTIPPADPAAKDAPTTLPPPPEPLDGFAAEEFRARRKALRAACPDGLLLIRGATESEAAFHAGGTYRQNSAFFYLTGVDTPDAFLVLLPDGLSAKAGNRDLPAEVREILFLPARNPATEAWTGAKLGPGKETEEATGFEKTLDAASIWGALTGWLQRDPLLCTLVPYGENARLHRNYAMMQRIADRAPSVQFRDCAGPLNQLRTVKSPAEIRRLREAIAVTAEGQIAARKLIARGAGMWEYEVEAAIFAAFRGKQGLLGFPSIVGTGINSTVLHYEENRCRMEAGDMVVVDIGARIGHYTGDLTRTYPVGGVFSPRQKEIHDLVEAAHSHVVASFEPGRDNDMSLKEKCLAFYKESALRAADSKGEEKSMDAFLPHGISHHLGLDVHDVGDRDLPFVPGNVITIEPGLYVAAEKIGVRLEDDYLVTETGLERLGPPLEREAASVEAASRA